MCYIAREHGTDGDPRRTDLSTPTRPGHLTPW